ncbi:hypothetical protein OS493_031963 [Desmophyllum pertusum]|uniref:Uncharacterized protein n=1 Tax=Desmophyllum pertusum TaxID=174260 RepID=A0A9X0D116_9CNID|nr:hypothetical protein OS493_031963 [Desmophyllum pertusum]
MDKQEKPDTHSTIYKEPAVRVPSVQRLTQIAQSLGLDLGEREKQEYRDAIATTLADTYQGCTSVPDPKLPVKYPRTPGYRPSAEENPTTHGTGAADIKGETHGTRRQNARYQR